MEKELRNKETETAKEARKSISKELDVCHDCAEYGGHFCDECLEEIINLKENVNGKTHDQAGKDSQSSIQS